LKNIKNETSTGSFCRQEGKIKGQRGGEFLWLRLFHRGETEKDFQGRGGINARALFVENSRLERGGGGWTENGQRNMAAEKCQGGKPCDAMKQGMEDGVSSKRENGANRTKKWENRSRKIRSNLGGESSGKPSRDS